MMYYTFRTFGLALEHSAKMFKYRLRVRLWEAITLVQKEAQSYLGHPQFDWKPLAAATETIKAYKGFPLGSPLLANGEMRDSIIKRLVSPYEGVVESFNRALYFHEKGTMYMPKRPVISRAIFKNKEKLMVILGGAMFPLITMTHYR